MLHRMAARLPLAALCAVLLASACCPRHRCIPEGVDASLALPRDPLGLTLEVDVDGVLLGELSLGDHVIDTGACTDVEPRVCATWREDAGQLAVRIDRTPEARPLLPEGGALTVRVLDADAVVAEGAGALRFVRAGGCLDQEPCPPHAALTL